MKKKNEKLMTAFDHIDARFVSEAMEYYQDKSRTRRCFSKKHNRFIVLASAACLVLILLAIPTLLIEQREHIFAPSGVGAEHPSADISTVPEHDGSRGLVYLINEDGESATFVGFGSCTDKTVVIASTYGGLPVTKASLGDNANVGNKFVKELIISDTVKVFNESVIASCINLERIRFGAGVEKIVPYKIQSGKLTSLEVSPENETLVSIGNCIVERATKTLVRGCRASVIPSDGSVEIIGNRAFFSVVGLYNITIPDCVTHIGAAAFALSDALLEVTLPHGLEYLGDNAFTGCSRLKVLDLNGYDILPRGVLYLCIELVELRGSENLTEIGEVALGRCQNLQITLSPSLEKIEKNAFLDCSAGVIFTGTIEEWKAIEKNIYWATYSYPKMMLKAVRCKDGDAAVLALPTPKK